MRTRLVFLIALVAVLVPATAVFAGLGGGSGGSDGFLLGGTAQNAQDPENASNDVIRIDTAVDPFYGTVSRKLDTKISKLDNMLEFKSYFQDRSCGGGSPRIQLSIDLNGDKVPDGNAFGYTGPPFAGCPPNTWQYDDVTDALPRWDLSQFVDNGLPANPCTGPAPPPSPICPATTHSGYVPWDVMEAGITALFPLHTVCDGALVDDSGWFAAASGTAYYDIVSMGRATWEDHADTAGRGFAQGCNRTNHGDDNHEGDDDRDHDRDHEDGEHRNDRHARWDK